MPTNEDDSHTSLSQPRTRRAMKRSHLRCMLKWTCAIACALLAVVFAISIRWFIRYTPQSNQFSAYLHDGGVLVSTVGLAGYFGTGLYIEDRETHDFPSDLTTGFPRREQDGPLDFYIIPLWLPLVVLLALTATLFYLDRRRVPPGHCRNCGYNLTGNVSGICPECGTKVKNAECKM